MSKGNTASTVVPETQTGESTPDSGLVVAKDKVVDNSNLRKAPMSKLYTGATAGEKFAVFIGITHSAGLGVLMPTFALIMGDLFDEFASAKPDFDPLILKFVWYFIASFWAAFWGTWCFEFLAERQVLRLRDNFFRSIVRQEIGWFDVCDPGKLSTQISEDIETYREGAGQKVATLVQSTCMFIGGYVVAFTKGWDMTLIMMATLPLMGVAGALLGAAIKYKTKGSLEAYAVSGSIAEETIAAIRTVQANGNQRHFAEKFEKNLVTAEKALLKGSIGIAMGIAALLCVMFLTYAIGFYYGGWRIVKENREYVEAGGVAGGCPSSECYQASTVLIVFFSCLMGSMSIAGMTEPIQALGKATMCLQRILDVNTRQSQIDSLDKENGVTINEATMESRVVFDQVKFRYPARPEAAVYESLSFSIEPGQTVALVGASGCGKSTAAQLLMRFYDPESGVVTLDGHDVRSLNVGWMRRQTAFVTQEPRLFADTIKNNIRAGKPDATDAEIEAAAKSANAHNFIMQFPAGYDTHVGQGGGQLSGGQKQRIAIARAIIRDPKILILDEATSALDNQSEKVVQQALDDLMAAKRRTTLVIAHRLTTIRRADKIVVLDNSNKQGSRVVEQGSHDELMKIPNGQYRKLVEGKVKSDMTNDAHEEDRIKVRAEKEIMEVKRKISKAVEDMDFRSNSVMSFQNGLAGGINVNDGITQRVSESKAVDFGDVITPEVTSGEARSRLFKMINDQKLWFALGCFGSMLRGGILPVLALSMSSMLGAFFSTDYDYMMGEVEKWSLVFVGLAVVQLGVNYFAFYSFGRIEAVVTSRIRALYFKAIIRQDIAYFDDPNNSIGDLVTNLSTNCVHIKAIVADSFNQAISTAVSLIAALIIAYILHWKLALVMTATMVIIVPGSGLQAKFKMMNHAAKQAKIKAQQDAQEGSAGFILTETIMAIRIVQALNMEELMLERFMKENNHSYKVGIKTSWGFAFAFAFASSSMFLTQIIAMKYGSYLFNNGELTIDDMFKVNNVLIMAAEGLGRNAVFASEQIQGVQAAMDIFTLCDRVPLVDTESDEGVQLDLEGKDIHFEATKFFYPTRPESRVFNGLSFTMPSGKTTALVGASGCGKSTTVQLLERFYTIRPGVCSKYDHDIVQQGDIRVNGVSINATNARQWRSQIGLVSQEPVLFSGTVAENIMLGKPDVKDPKSGEYHAPPTMMSEIEEAAKKSNAYSFVSEFPEGFHTDVGKGGSQLSGGQKQRVAIARAIIRNPKLLILDEATSALDNESERIVQQALDDLMATTKRTTLVIAHRLSTIRNADKIVVFDNDDKQGSVVREEGTHEELMAIPNGIYRNLVEIAETAAH